MDLRSKTFYATGIKKSLFQNQEIKTDSLTQNVVDVMSLDLLAMRLSLVFLIADVLKTSSVEQLQWHLIFNLWRSLVGPLVLGELKKSTTAKGFVLLKMCKIYLRKITEDIGILRCR